jgi:predicted nucleic acid-binding protein
MAESKMDEFFVVDNSIVMSWCFKDEANSYADAVLERLTRSKVFVPAIWPLEVVNILLVAERKKRLKPSASAHFLTLLSQLPIEVESNRLPTEMPNLLALGRNLDLSSYDLSYLDLAMRSGCPLATLDKKLIEAAETVGVLKLAV